MVGHLRSYSFFTKMNNIFGHVGYKNTPKNQALKAWNPAKYEA